MKRFSALIAASAILLASLVFLCVPLRATEFEMPFARENHNVTIRVGVMDVPGDKIDFCVKAEGRRLVFYVPGFDFSRISEGPETSDGIRTDVGSSGLRRFDFTFSVNVRTPQINLTGDTGGRVSLKPDEIGHPRWDDVLSMTSASPPRTGNRSGRFITPSMSSRTPPCRSSTSRATPPCATRRMSRGQRGA